MQALANIAEDDQDIHSQVLPLIEQLAATGTPAMRARGRKLLARLVRSNR